MHISYRKQITIKIWKYTGRFYNVQKLPGDSHRDLCWTLSKQCKNSLLLLSQLENWEETIVVLCKSEV